jgi:protoporphyrinogen oxidase
MSTPKYAVVIIGAGPAGLTAALELSKHPDYSVKLVEQSNQVGGISRTVNYKGNLIDLGGHRFFSKHDKVLKWWADIMPVKGEINTKTITYHNKKKALPKNLNLTHSQFSLLLRPRKSRIYYRNHFFDYPLQLKYKLLKGLGFYKSFLISLGILRARLWPIKPEKNLEDFYINRFGKELYNTFFKDYTKKIWGKDCKEISSEWGRQRVKSLSISRIIRHSIANAFRTPSLLNKKTETSLIEYFLYPAKGPGQMWELVKDKCLANGVELIMQARVNEVGVKDSRAEYVCYKNDEGETLKLKADYVISSMPVRPFIKSLTSVVPKKVQQIAEGLEYRDFIIVGLLLKDILLKDKKQKIVSDNWLYIQDNTVQVGRLQLFNNWSPFMVEEPTNVWLGAEYFCNRTDELWRLDDEDLISFAVKELERIGVINSNDVLDGTVVRAPKAYPSYTGAYESFGLIKDYLSTLKNIYPVGRNGMHKYNNQDHSMLTAFKATNMILNNSRDFEALWSINTEEVYNEEKNKV